MKLNNVLLCCTGSVATIKAPVIINDLKNLGLNVKVIFTKYASHFCSASDIKANEVEIYTDEDEWSTWNKRGDPVLHIELSKWADVLLIAPLDANTLAKISQVCS